MVYYPTLISEMAKRGITKKKLAEATGICFKSLQNRLLGKVPFTWPEVKQIRNSFFPDIAPDELFATVEELQDSA